MFLKTLKLKGFKSFAKPVTLNFSKGLSVIVGPNGTGKSNIVDAILWVLGEQNPRFLRGQTMQDIIFSGTEKIQPSPLAEVTLIFDNSDSSIPLDSPEVSVKRILSRDGTSQYFLNERPCRLLDIREALSHLNLGRELPGIVPQNRIYELINPTSSDLKSIIEESSGVGYFRLKKESAERKLLDAQEKLEKIKLLESEIKKQLTPLKKQAEDYQKVLQLKTEIEQLRIKKTLSELLEYRKKHEDLEREILATENETKRIDTELESLEQKKKMLESLAEKNSAIARQATYVSKLSDFHQNFNLIKLLLEEKAKSTLERISSQAQMVYSLSAEVKKRRETFESAMLKIGSIEKNLKELKKRKEAFIREIEKLNSNKQRIEHEISEDETQLKKKKMEEEQVEKRITEIEFELSKTAEESRRIKQRIGEISSGLAEVSQELLKISEAEKKNEELLIMLQKELAKLKEKIGELEKVYGKKSAQFEDMVAKRKKLEAELQRTEESIKSYSTDLKKAEDFKPLTDKELKKLQAALPHGGPLYVVFSDELENLKNFPVHFILTPKNDATDVIESLLENIEKIANEQQTFSLSGVFYHPAGFYYRSSFEEGYYHLLEKKRSLEKLLYETKKSEHELVGKVKKLEAEIGSLREKINNLSEKESKLKETLKSALIKKQKIAVQIDFYEEEKKRLEIHAGNLEKRILELEKLRQENIELLENLRSRTKELISKKTEKETILENLAYAIKEIKKKLLETERLESQAEFELKILRNEINENEKRIDELSNALRVSKEMVTGFEKKLKLLNEIHRIGEEFIDTIRILRSAYSYLGSYEEELKNQAREMSKILDLSQRLYERKSRLDSRKQVLVNQLEELTKKIKEHVQKVEEMALVPVDRAFENYEITEPSEEYARHLRILEEKLNRIGDYNPFAIRDYEVLNSRYEKIRKQGADIKSAIENLKTIIDEVDGKIVKAFKKSFEELNHNFERIYSIFTNGGKAEITVEAVDTLDDARFTIRVSQPGKNLKNINLLSGGEKSLASLALLMALEKTFKFPFLVFDEVEAALDEVNLQRFISYLRKVAENTQIIMVTHQPLTVEAADVIYGVTVDREGSSRVYSLRLEQVEEFDVKL